MRKSLVQVKRLRLYVFHQIGILDLTGAFAYVVKVLYV